MQSSTHYQTLKVHPRASQDEIKQSYRRLVKQHHPDHHPRQQGHDVIAQINAAYEVLGDPGHRQRYDQQLYGQSSRVSSQQGHQYPTGTPSGYGPTAAHTVDEQLHAWLKWVYAPVNDLLDTILDPLTEQIDLLAADPFDDLLMEEFQDYLTTCRETLTEARGCFQSMPNPANLAGIAAHLYYCLNQVGDGLEELEYFTLNYDDHYLHRGQELFRIAEGLRWEAAGAVAEFATVF